MKRNIIYKLLPDGNMDTIRNDQTGSMSVLHAATASYIQANNIDGTVATAVSASYIQANNIDGTVATAVTAVSASYISYSDIDFTGLPTSSLGVPTGSIYASGSYLRIV